MHGGFRSEDEPMAEMNMIPLIDIALVLVIILMVTTVFIKHPGVSLKLPETATREGAPETKKDLTVVVSATGDLYVDGQKTTTPALQQHLRVIAKRDRQSRILVKGDRDVAYARVMDVMDMVRQAGLTRVVLPTDPKIGQPDTAPTSPPAQRVPTASARAGLVPASLPNP
jgi:biopolymer transport protein TolR